jgi:threonine synthase
MGLPVNKLIVASNSNNVLTDFIETGTYDRTREFHKTISPSMDILISSNLERLLYTLGGAELTSELMTSLKENGKYDAPSDIMDKLRDNFCGYYMTEEETKEIIKEVYQNHGYLMDPHTAVGYGCVSKYIRATGDNTPVILASTASPYKFAPAVNDALGIDSGNDDISSLEALSSSTGTSIPHPLKEALNLEIRFNEVIDPSEMPDIPFKV